MKNLAVYVFNDPTTPNAHLRVSKAAYDASTPAQQFAFQMSIGALPKGAAISVNADGSWGYTLPQTSGGYNSTVNIGMTSDVLAQMKIDNPAEYQQYMKDVLTMGNGAAYNAHQTIITTAQNEVMQSEFNTWAATLPVALQLVVRPAYQNAGGGNAGITAANNAMTVYNTQQLQNYVSSLNSYQKDIYNKASNNGTNSDAGILAVQNAQKAALAEVNSHILTTETQTTILPNGSKNVQSVPVYDFSKIAQQTWMIAGFSGTDYGYIHNGIANALSQPNKAVAMTGFAPVTSMSPSIADLSSYKYSIVLPQFDKPGQTPTLTETYNIFGAVINGKTVPGFIQNNPNQKSIQELKDAGFPQSVISQAQNYLDSITGLLPGINVLVGSVNRNGNVSVKNASLMLSLQNAIDSSGVTIPYTPATNSEGLLLSSNETTAAIWNALTPEEQAQVANVYAQDLYKSNYFSEVVGMAEYAKAQAGMFATLESIAQPFVPIVGMPLTAAEMIAQTSAKASTGQKVSGMEIGVDTASVVASALGVPGVSTMLGPEPTLALQAGVFGTFGANIGMNYSKMTPDERALNIGMLVAPILAGPAIHAGENVVLSMRSDYIPLRSMSMEAQTARIEPTPEQWTTMLAAGVTEDDVMGAINDLNRQLVSGADVASTKLGPVTFEIKNIPYQQDVGLSLFHATPDISVYDRGDSVPAIKDLYLAAKVAIEPLERSYVSGQQATNPGIVEIRIADPDAIADIAPALKQLGNLGGDLESEALVKSLDALEGMGYRLVPIPEEAGGRGVTFDANLGKIDILRFTLAKVTDNPTGISTVVTGGSGDGGLVVIPDLHATTQFQGVFDAVNSKFSEPIIEGDPADPNTWHYVSSDVSKGRTVVQAGDLLDPGDVGVYTRHGVIRLIDFTMKQLQAELVTELCGFLATTN